MCLHIFATEQKRPTTAIPLSLPNSNPQFIWGFLFGAKQAESAFFANTKKFAVQYAYATRAK